MYTCHFGHFTIPILLIVLTDIYNFFLASLDPRGIDFCSFFTGPIKRHANRPPREIKNRRSFGCHGGREVIMKFHSALIAMCFSTAVLRY